MSKVKKEDIGKGIRALLSNIDKEVAQPKPGVKLEAPVGTLEVSISSIEANPFQPRTEFDEELLQDLAVSIKTFGVIQPITVRKLNSRKYQIISGERRWRAAKAAGLKKIPAYIREADDQGMLEMSLLENIQRADLNPLEVALSYQRLLDECKLTHQELSSRLGKKRSSISNHIRVLKLPPTIQQALRTSRISLGHAKVIAGFSRIEDQLELLDQILKNELSVRSAEALAARFSQQAPKKQPQSSTHPEVQGLEDRLSERFGTPVKISRNAKGRGSLKFNFKTDQELNLILDVLLSDEI